jgi:hypothetical protein
MRCDFFTIVSVTLPPHGLPSTVIYALTIRSRQQSKRFTMTICLILVFLASVTVAQFLGTVRSGYCELCQIVRLFPSVSPGHELWP